MASKQKKQTAQLQKKSVGTWEWLAFLMFGIFMVLWPFQYGFFNGAGLHSDTQFFFEKKIYYGILLGIPILLLVIAKFIRAEKWEQRHLIALIGFALPLLYWINSFRAETAYMNKISLHNSIMLYAFFVMGILISGSVPTLKRLIHFYYGIGSLVVVYSFGYLFGNRYRMDALVFSDEVRLTSIFTYANAYAAFLITLLLITVYQLTSVTKRSIQLAYAIMLVPICVSLLLTLSRGAMLMLPVIAIVALLLVNLRRQLLILIYVVIAFILSLSIQSSLSDKGLAVYNRIQASLSASQPVKTVSFFSSDSIFGWLQVAAVAVIMMAIVYVISKYNEKVRLEKWNRKLAQLYIPVILVIVSIAGFVSLRAGLLNSILPKQLSERLNNFSFNTHSVLERFTFYKDSLTLWRENKLIGGGGGTWEALYDRYQSYPYVSSQPHSYLIDLLLDTGLIGLLLVAGGFLYLIVAFLYQFYKGKINERNDYLLFLLLPLSILLHSVIDFEMTYSFFAILVFFCIGVLAGQQRKEIFANRKSAEHNGAKYGMVALWAVLAIYLLIGTANAFTANSKYTKSLEMLYAQMPFNQLTDELEAGLKRVPGHPFILKQLAANYTGAFTQTGEQSYETNAQKYTNQLISAEPNSNLSIKAQYSLATALKDQTAANQAMEDAMSKFPYEISYYEQAIKDRFQQWLTYQAANDSNNQQAEETAIREIVSLHDERAQELTKLSKKIVYIRTFTWSEETKAILEQLKI
ncbi:O-antigen ligase family protein [Cohnella thailandensis]|uniref:O-antigen ligase family protein n=1 Tax=Cohnella thailandensis TaxID=557557 RepID=A0A841T3D4_9BACL|nr:O-antigen ligase family protein [Cohnella thailandensis]MBB6638132.1 O-antigen ligase family protein [Cohnella thailandensis]MBP1971941.1 hypothetical protein [Cohnella thailandensis]